MTVLRGDVLRWDVYFVGCAEIFGRERSYLVRGNAQGTKFPVRLVRSCFT